MLKWGKRISRVRRRACMSRPYRGTLTHKKRCCSTERDDAYPAQKATAATVETEREPFCSLKIITIPPQIWGGEVIPAF